MMTVRFALSVVLLLIVISFESWLHYIYLTTSIDKARRLIISDVSQQTLEASSRSTLTAADEDACGQICSIEFSGQRPGRYYPLLSKHVSCPAIMRRMARQPATPVVPAPICPPADTLRQFTQHGQCPLKSGVWYFDQSNATSNPNQQLRFNGTTFSRLLRADRGDKVISHYGDPHRILKPTLGRYRRHIRDGHVAVVGTEMPWAEAMLINLGAGRVTTLEYRTLVIEHRRVSTVTPSQFARNFLEATDNGNATEQFDAVFSYSSLEHAGLGRYGDPLAPWGDVEATAQMWCSMRPGGLFFLALPSFADADQRRRRCQLVWNAHRVYGYVRLQHVTANWEVLDEVDMRDGLPHFLYVLRKPHRSIPGRRHER